MLRERIKSFQFLLPSSTKRFTTNEKQTLSHFLEKLSITKAIYQLQPSQIKRTYSKIESVTSCRFQIHLYIFACAMIREFTPEVVTKFLPAQFPWFWCKCLLRNSIHSKIFNLTKYWEFVLKYLLLITRAEMPIWIWRLLWERLTDSIQIIN